MRIRWDIWLLMAVLGFAVWMAFKGAPLVEAAAEKRAMHENIGK